LIKAVYLFCVGAIFEMRTVLYGICLGIRLLIDGVKTHNRVFITNNFCREESKTAERQKERERERERQHVGNSIGNKIVHYRKYLKQMWEQFDPIAMAVNDWFPTIRISISTFHLLIYQ
jgi:hypothetical protein